MIRGEPLKVKDPAYGMETGSGKVRYKTELFGKTYYFCSEMDLDKFLEDPEKSVRGELVSRGYK